MPASTLSCHLLSGMNHRVASVAKEIAWEYHAMKLTAPSHSVNAVWVNHKEDNDFGGCHVLTARAIPSLAQRH